MGKVTFYNKIQALRVSERNYVSKHTGVQIYTHMFMPVFSICQDIWFNLKCEACSLSNSKMW